MANSISNFESYAISSNLFPCVFVGMYETGLSSTKYEEDMSSCYCDSEHPFSYVTVDQERWELEIVERAGKFISERVVPMMQKYGLKDIQVEQIHSPKYYNFETDCLYFTVIMQKTWRRKMKKFLKEFRKDEKFDNYICEHYHSHSGFCSFMPQDIDEIEAFDDEERCIGAYLTLCLLNEGQIDMADEFYEDCSEWLWENTCADETHDLLEENSLDFDSFDVEELVALYNNDEKWNEIYWNLVKKLNGFPWLHDEKTKCIEGKADCFMSHNAENDGMRLLFWAAQQGYKANDLIRMAA